MLGLKRFTLAAAAALAVTLGLGAHEAAASTVIGSCIGAGDPPAFDVTNNVTPTSLCFSLEGLSDGDAAKLADLNGLEINGATGGWTSLDKFEPFGSNSYFEVTETDSKNGTWSLFQAAIDAYGEFMMVFKAGQDNNTDPAAFVGYILDGTSGDWSSPLLKENNTAEQRALSNVELFARGEPTVIPLPAGGLLLITALGGLGFAARSRRKAA